MAERRRGLGRGLGALIPSAPVEAPPVQERDPADRQTSAAVTASSGEGPLSDSSTPTSGRAKSDQSDGGAVQTTTVQHSLVEVPHAAGGSARDSDTSPEGANSADSAERRTPSHHGDDQQEKPTVSRETPKLKKKKRVVSPEARQSAMQSRLTMDSPRRSRAGSARPSDMFFTPTPASADTPSSADSPDEAADTSSPSDIEQHVPQRESVSRETAEPLVDQQRAAQKTVVETPDIRTAGASDDLLQDGAASTTGLGAVPGARFAEIAVRDIHPNRKQPRQVFDDDEMAELAYSIGELGVLQPIVVRVSRETDGPSYELVMGERRWRATQRAGLDTIPAIIRETADDELLRDALLENLHRSQLNPLEEAAAYQQLLEEFGATQEELSRRIGRSRPQISNTLRLMKLPPLVQRRVAAGILSAGHARALLTLEDPAEIERLAQRIVAEGLSVRAAEEAASLAKRGGGRRRTPSPASEPHRERLNYIADAFSDKLDTSVKINLGSRKGKMTIEFASVEDLNRIISVLDPQADGAD